MRKSERCSGPAVDQTPGSPWKVVRTHPWPFLCQGKYSTRSEASNAAKDLKTTNPEETWEPTRL